MVRKDYGLDNQQELFKMGKIKHNKDFNHPYFPHSMNGYRYGCRCEICSQAAKEYYIFSCLKKDPAYKPTRRHTAKRITHGKDINHPAFPHGTTAGYSAGCKCDECKRANADKDLKYRKEKNPNYVPRFRKIMYLKPEHPDFPHGTNDGYSRGGCECIDCVNAHKAFKRAYNKQWNNNPQEKQKQKIRQANYRNTEVGSANHRAQQAKRRALKKAANNCAVSDMELLKLIYLNCPEGYHVDHIQPLSKGGLHHPNNLQYLPALINMRKNNNADYDCSEHVVIWQSLLDTSSTTIPSGSTPKRVEALHTLEKITG